MEINLMRNKIKINKYILGAVRELVSYDEKLFLLADNIDSREMGILTPHTPEEWEDEDMLMRISSKSHNFRKCYVCGKHFNITLQNNSGFIDNLPYCGACMSELDDRGQQQATSSEY